MNENLDDWEDGKAQELYLTACNSPAGGKRSKAIHELGKLARGGSNDAVFALKSIARKPVNSGDQELAVKELTKG